MTSELHKYPELEQHLNEYELSQMSKPPSSYLLNLVREFFANYLELIEKDCPKGTKISDLPNRN